MSKEKDKTNQPAELQITTIGDLQVSYKQLSDAHLSQRFTNNPEFKAKFLKTFSDLVFSQNQDTLDLLPKMNQNSLLNSVFKATEAGASFSKGEVSLIPFKIRKKVKEGNVEKTIDTGEFTALVIIDINFQKQQILKLQNCKRFFTAEVHEGVKVIENLKTGTTDFEGDNDVTKPTIGYYACFITTEGEKYDKFMTNSQIIDRAKFSPQYKAENYKNTTNNIHFEKVVVRNLLKEIPKVSDELRSIISVEEAAEYAEYVEVHEAIEEAPESQPKKVNQLEEAKKELAKENPKAKPKSTKEKVDKETGEVEEVESEEEFF